MTLAQRAGARADELCEGLRDGRTGVELALSDLVGRVAPLPLAVSLVGAVVAARSGSERRATRSLIALDASEIDLLHLASSRPGYGGTFPSDMPVFRSTPASSSSAIRGRPIPPDHSPRSPGASSSHSHSTWERLR